MKPIKITRRIEKVYNAFKEFYEASNQKHFIRGIEMFAREHGFDHRVMSTLTKMGIIKNYGTKRNCQWHWMVGEPTVNMVVQVLNKTAMREKERKNKNSIQNGKKKKEIKSNELKFPSSIIITDESGNNQMEIKQQDKMTPKEIIHDLDYRITRLESANTPDKRKDEVDNDIKMLQKNHWRNADFIMELQEKVKDLETRADAATETIQEAYTELVKIENKIDLLQRKKRFYSIIPKFKIQIPIKFQSPIKRIVNGNLPQE